MKLFKIIIIIINKIAQLPFGKKQLWDVPRMVAGQCVKLGQCISFARSGMPLFNARYRCISWKLKSAVCILQCAFLGATLWQTIVAHPVAVSSCVKDKCIDDPFLQVNKS